MHWWPRQTPSSGIRGPNRSTTSLEIPASRGVHGPGEMISRLGRGRLDLVERDLIVADHPQLEPGVDLAETLDQVIGERVVVINQEDQVMESLRRTAGIP